MVVWRRWGAVFFFVCGWRGGAAAAAGEVASERAVCVCVVEVVVEHSKRRASSTLSPATKRRAALAFCPAPTPRPKRAHPHAAAPPPRRAAGLLAGSRMRSDPNKYRNWPAEDRCRGLARGLLLPPGRHMPRLRGRCSLAPTRSSPRSLTWPVDRGLAQRALESVSCAGGSRAKGLARRWRFRPAEGSRAAAAGSKRARSATTCGDAADLKLLETGQSRARIGVVEGGASEGARLSSWGRLACARSSVATAAPAFSLLLAKARAPCCPLPSHNALPDQVVPPDTACPATVPNNARTPPKHQKARRRSARWRRPL